jgi:hypothetical protein
MTSVILTQAPFEAQCAPSSGKPTIPASDATLMITPPR